MKIDSCFFLLNRVCTVQETYEISGQGTVMLGLTTLFLIIYPRAQTLHFFVPLREPGPPRERGGKKEEFNICSEEKLTQKKNKHMLQFFLS